MTKKYLYQLKIELVSDTDERARAILDFVDRLGGNSPGGVGDIGIAVEVCGSDEGEDPHVLNMPPNEDTRLYAHGYDPVVIKAVLRDAFELGFDCDFAPNGTVEDDPEEVDRIASMNMLRKLKSGEYALRKLESGELVSRALARAA